jgi:hypothetical protein
MDANDLKNSSETNWERIDLMTDELSELEQHSARIYADEHQH